MALYVALLVVLVRQGGATASQGEMAVWVEPATRKVFREEAAPAGASGTIALDCARGETEAAQVVIRARRRLEAVGCAVAPAGGAGARDLPLRWVRLLLPHYVFVRYPSGNWEQRPRYWPDALPPARAFPLEGGRAQPVWVSVAVPRDAEPGEYRGFVTVRAAGGEAVEVPIVVNVRRISLPDRPRFRASFGVWWSGIRERFGLQAGSAAERAAFERFLGLLLRSRVSPLDLPWSVFSTEGAEVARRPEVNAFRVPWPYGDRPLDETVGRLRELGLAEKAYFYLRDEPRYEHYEEVRQMAAQAAAKAPEVARLCTVPPVPELVGAVTRWCVQPEEAYMHEATLRERQREGDEVWWYLMAVPKSPYPTFLLDDLALAPRALLWGAAKEGVTGLLYINTIYWGWEGRDEWQESLITMPALRNNMDGLLVYSRGGPGGPYAVSSIRLECIRDGIEDWELLRELEEGASRALEGRVSDPRAAAQEHLAGLVHPVMADLRRWTHSPLVLEQARRSLLDQLELLANDPPRWLAECYRPLHPLPEPSSNVSEEKRLVAARGEPSPVPDGALLEPEWGRAFEAGGDRTASRFVNLHGVPWPSVGTRVAALWGKRGVWFGWQCLDELEGRGRECVEMSLAASSEYPPLVLRLWPSGEKEAYRGEQQVRRRWGAGVAHDSEGWTAEVFVPWSALGVSAIPPSHRLWVNFARERPGAGEQLRWCARYGSRPNWTQLGVLELKSQP